MKVYVPYDDDNPKTRLSPLFNADERVGFVRACLRDVCEAVEDAGEEPVILSTRHLDTPYENVVRDEPLTPAVNSVLADAVPSVGVVVADLPLVTPDALRRLFATDAGFVVAPGRGGGTNAFVSRVEGFRVNYHGTSFLDHRDHARELGAEVRVVDSFRLSTDADERADLVEVLLHGDGHAAEFARERLELVEDGDRRVRVERRDGADVS